jgi:hypothetical protein
MGMGMGLLMVWLGEERGEPAPWVWRDNAIINVLSRENTICHAQGLLPVLKTVTTEIPNKEEILSKLSWQFELLSCRCT